MSYSKFDGAVPDDLSSLVFPSFTYRYQIVKNGLKITDRLLSLTDYWNPDPNLSANSSGNWWLGLTRTNPGVAEITTGVTRDMTY